MSYSLMIAPFDFANHKKIAAQQFFDNYAFFELTPKRAKEYFLWYKNEIPNRITMLWEYMKEERPESQPFIEIGTRPVDAGLSNLGRVKGTVTEDNIPGEGIIYYDIRFTAYLREKEMKILINIEAQKSTDSGKLGYHLENRIMFYLARMISAQKQTEFFHSDFDNLKKVRSIWICMDSGETEDSIEEIGFDRKTVFGNKRNAYHTDLMKGIIVNIRNEENNNPGKVMKKSQNVPIAMLEELLSEKDAVEKKRILTDEYGMIMTTELEGRIQIMCNWSESIEERSIRRERLNAIEGKK